MNGAIDWLRWLLHWVMAFIWWIWDAHFAWLMILLTIAIGVLTYGMLGAT